MSELQGGEANGPYRLHCAHAERRQWAEAHISSVKLNQTCARGTTLGMWMHSDCAYQRSAFGRPPICKTTTAGKAHGRATRAYVRRRLRPGRHTTHACATSRQPSSARSPPLPATYAPSSEDKTELISESQSTTSSRPRLVRAQG